MSNKVHVFVRTGEKVPIDLGECIEFEVYNIRPADPFESASAEAHRTRPPRCYYLSPSNFCFRKCDATGPARRPLLGLDDHPRRRNKAQYIASHLVQVAHDYLDSGWVTLPPQLEPYRQQATGDAFVKWLGEHANKPLEACTPSMRADEANADRLRSALCDSGATDEASSTKEGVLRRMTGLTEREYKKAVRALKLENVLRTKSGVGTWLAS